jgi:DNA primase
MSDIPFADIQAAARPFVEQLIPRWVPGAVRKGGWMMACSPFRDDKHPSFGVSLETGWYRDFATGEKGDLIDLLVKLRGISKVEAARELARVVGHSFAEGK